VHDNSTVTYITTNKQNSLRQFLKKSRTADYFIITSCTLYDGQSEMCSAIQ
jgi:hypothetical protein